MIDELKQNKKAVGLKQSLKAIESGTAVKAYLARDCAPHIFDEIENNCIKHRVTVEYADTMSELGRACGIDVGAAVAVMIKG